MRGGEGDKEEKTKRGERRGKGREGEKAEKAEQGEKQWKGAENGKGAYEGKGKQKAEVASLRSTRSKKSVGSGKGSVLVGEKSVD